ncbi:MAG: DUF1289 domain-containing protein [Methylocystaceae bacterium]|jgi:hypothetical protein|nr:DUF1289 domain-containing protein [Methylocystaceae bacterium]
MVESPCKKLCALNADDVCLGCGRTREEIGAWTMMTDASRSKVKTLAKQRLQTLGQRSGLIDSRTQRA